MKIASWNVNSLNVRLPHLSTWLAQAAPDVVALQETKLEDAKFPDSELASLGYLSVFSGQKTYNGVALLSRQPARDVVTDIGGLTDPQRRILIATIGDIRVVNLYVVNGQSVGSEKYAYKLDWLAKVHDWLAAELQRFPKMIVLGDFNIAPHPIDLARPRGNETTSGFLPEERALFKRCLGRGYLDTFRTLHPEAVRYSWWSNRIGVRDRNIGWRIDHVVASRDLLSRLRAAFVWDHVRGSDHCPVGIDLDGPR